MDDIQELFFSYTGEPRNRQSASVHTMPTDQIRRAAISLYVNIRQRQEEAGEEPIAVVWIGAKRLNPTIAELDEYHRHIEAIFERERKWRTARADDPEDEDESSAREESEEVREVELTEDDFAAAARGDEPSDEPEEPPLVDLIGLDMGFDSDSDLEI